MKYIYFHTYLHGAIRYTIPHIIAFSLEFVVLLEFRLWRRKWNRNWNKDSETEIKNLGGNIIMYNAHNTRSLIRAIKYVEAWRSKTSSQTKEASTVKAYKHTHTRSMHACTHTHTHTCTHAHARTHAHTHARTLSRSTICHMLGLLCGASGQKSKIWHSFFKVRILASNFRTFPARCALRPSSRVSLK